MSSFYVITQYIIYDCLFYFNPRSREGSDALTLTALTCPKISIRVPTRGATGMALHHCVGNTISIRAPTRGATSYASRSLWECAFQSALPRGERPRYPSARSFPGVISIRAPARGATHGRRQTGYITKFQSALPRGERQVDRVSFCMSRDFNPRSREGSDFLSQEACCRFTISIRAPARGATQYGRILSVAQGFQSALPRGERRRNAVIC